MVSIRVIYMAHIHKEPLGPASFRTEERDPTKAEALLSDPDIPSEYVGPQFH